MSNERPPRMRELRVVRGPVAVSSAAHTAAGPKSPSPTPGRPVGRATSPRDAVRAAGLDPDQVAGTLRTLAGRLDEALAELHSIGLCRPPVTEEFRTTLDAITTAAPAAAPAVREALKLIDDVPFGSPADTTIDHLTHARDIACRGRDELAPAQNVERRRGERSA